MMNAFLKKLSLKEIQICGDKMIYDCFRFFNEEELVELRMNILDKYVDKFVVTECSVSHAGNAIEQRFPALVKRKLNKFSHKIVYNYVTNTPTNFDFCDTSPWPRDADSFETDAWQREQSLASIRSCCDNDDIIIFGDLDEIPSLNEENIALCKKHDLVHFRNEMFMYYLNLHKESGWYGSKMMTGKFVKQYHSRTIRTYLTSLGVNFFGGWHWCFMGGVKKMIEKLEAYGHQELNNDFIKSSLEKNITDLKDIFYRYGDTKFSILNIDERFPDEIRENLDKYSTFIKQI